MTKEELHKLFKIGKREDIAQALKTWWKENPRWKKTDSDKIVAVAQTIFAIDK